jgi:hypothetical protein
MWGFPLANICSHGPDFRVDDLREFTRAYDLRAVIEDVSFRISMGP